MTKWVCKLCIAAHGLKGSDLPNWPDEDDFEACAKHMESEHHVPIRRDGETEHEASERFCRDYPEAGGPNCKCPTCVEIRRLKAARQ